MAAAAGLMGGVFGAVLVDTGIFLAGALADEFWASGNFRIGTLAGGETLGRPTKGTLKQIYL